MSPQVLKQYTNAAATVTSELLSFTTKFAVQVRPIRLGTGCLMSAC